MALFSEREGLTKIPKDPASLIDKGFRNRLWNIIRIFIWNQTKTQVTYNDLMMREDIQVPTDGLKSLLYALWVDFFEFSIDDIPRNWHDIISSIKHKFYSCEWFKLFDFLEFLAKAIEKYLPDMHTKFIKSCNTAFSKKKCDCRFTDNILVPLIQNHEITEIEKTVSTPIESINNHFKNALINISSRENPDYHNSIKESISGVESICKIIINESNTSLGKAIKKLDSKILIHPSIKSGIDKLWGYASQVARHGLVEKTENVTLSEARLVLILCSGITNYLYDLAKKAKVIE